MPRSSPYVITLTPNERRVLEARARQYTLSYRDVVRAKIVLLAAEGIQNKEIAERLDMPRPVVSKWRKRFYRERLEGLEDRSRRGRPPAFPPRVVAEVKALASELPSTLGLPLSRFSRSELRRQVLAAGIVADISGTTIWRWLHADALRPWSRRSWIFPRDPEFGPKAERVLDLYHRQWNGRALSGDEFVISADEKTQIPIRTRRHPITPPGPGRSMRVEHEYRRHGVCAYIAAWDVHRARLFGNVVAKISIVAFDALVAQVMAREPYRSAGRVFWIVDGGTIHRGQRAADRLPDTVRQPHPGAPAHARELDEPDRDLLLDPPAQGTHPRPLLFPGRSRRAHPRLPAALPANRLALRMEVHPLRSQPPPGPLAHPAHPSLREAA